jgi:UDP-N-acetylmuramoyl-L-alanyl-D-glutamate--2,6-diaminopimelate ligase
MLIKIKNKEVWTSLVGDFNLQNLLAVYAVAELFNLSQLDILKQISCLSNVEGRFQTFQTPMNITVIIDYAHTPDALENVLRTINTIRTRNETLITLLGCGGNRDQEKRPLMGHTAAKYSDKIIFTSDNPREEDPGQIISQMVLGVSEEHFKKILRITLREEAIAMAAELASNGDIVLIAGKGHESHQEINGHFYPFSDIQIAKKIFLKTD